VVLPFNSANGSSHIASSAYQKGPTLDLAIVSGVQLRDSLNTRLFTYLKFENKGISFETLVSNHSLYQIKLYRDLSYPEGNFAWNQLLDGSIGLSPLYSCQTNDLHVSIASDLHQGFPCLRPAQA